ncbi:MAG: class I SAM-dependent RNA methyltransferase, partial [Ignavibacteria bacterium]|nr:class I SAM-dependent RNA methyltransferase [Ignavibacteria bacterium]
MYEYQKNNTFFAQAPGMMEEICEQELIELGAKNTKIAYRGIYFEADKSSLYRINYTARTISRVLAPLKNFYCRDAKVIMREAESVEWEKIFSVDQTFSITSSVNKSTINNSLYASQVLKDGIADYFRSKFDKRPNVDTVTPDVRFNLFIEKDKAILSLDTSGESLHKRGYRLLAGEAPMQETLAAAIIRLSKWEGEKPLLDCMCGSGTILCEALMHYCRIPAQKLRKNFGFFYLPDFNKEIWEKLKQEADQMIRPLPKGLIGGSDRSQITLKIANDNLSRLPYSDAITLSAHPFQHIKQFENGVLITNPPYGIRLGNRDEVEVLYKELGDFLKTKCKGTSAFIYTGDPSLRKHIGLKTSKRTPLVNGKLEGVLLQIDSYEGSKKKKYQTNQPDE